jgi:hypothetical protein
MLFECENKTRRKSSFNDDLVGKTVNAAKDWPCKAI